MSTFTRDNTVLAFEEEGVGRQLRGEAGGMVVAIEHWQAGMDTAEMFAGLPDGACQEPHWGYIQAGRIDVRYTDGRTESLSGGDVYHLEPGHNVTVVEDVDIVEFSRTDEGEGINSLTGS